MDTKTLVCEFYCFFFTFQQNLEIQQRSRLSEAELEELERKEAEVKKNILGCTSVRYAYLIRC